MEKCRKPNRKPARPTKDASNECETERPPEPGRADFARAIARAEFGRHYWDDRMADELQASLTGRRKK